MPQIGEKRSDGRVWAGDDFGWQSPATIWKRQPPGKVGDTRTLPGLGTKVYTGTDYGWQTQATIDKNKTQQPKLDPTSEPTTTTTTTPTTTTTTPTTPTTTTTTPTTTTTTTQQPRPKPLTPNQEYQKAAAAARNVQDPKARADAMKSVRDAGMKIWADKYKNTLAPEVVRRQERATMLGRGETQSGYKIIKQYVKPSVEKTTEAYEVVLDYLLSEGHADTLEEAHYVMMQLDSEFIQNIIEN